MSRLKRAKNDLLQYAIWALTPILLVFFAEVFYSVWENGALPQMVSALAGIAVLAVYGLIRVLSSSTLLLRAILFASELSSNKDEALRRVARDLTEAVSDQKNATAGFAHSDHGMRPR